MWIQSDVFNILQDYGVRQGPKRKDIDKMKSSLPPQLLELMNMLFNIETYRCDFTVLFSGFACAHALFLVLEKNFTLFCTRAAMLEFKINMSEMPLGKLSKENIQKGVILCSLWNSFC